MSYKSLQEGSAIGSALMQFGLTYSGAVKDKEKDEIEKRSFQIADELAKNAKARKADPSIPEYKPEIKTPADAKAAWQGGLMYAEKMAADLNLDNSRMDNQAKKARADLDVAAKKLRVFMATTDKEDKHSQFKELFNKHMASGNTITDIAEDGTATFTSRDGKTSTKKLTDEAMATTLNTYFADPKEALQRHVSSIMLTRQQNRDRLRKPQLLERENEDGGKEYMWRVEGLVNPETMDEIDEPFYTKEYPPYDTKKLKEKDIGDMSRWKPVDSAETPTEKKVKGLDIKQLEQGLATSKQTEKTSAASEKKIIQETKNLKNVPAAKQDEAELKKKERREKGEKATIELAKTDAGLNSEMFDMTDEKSKGFRLVVKATSLLYGNTDPDKITPGEAFTGVREILDAAEKYADGSKELKAINKEDDPEGYKAKKYQIMSEFVEYSLRGAQEEAPETVDPQKLVEASKAAPPTKSKTLRDRFGLNPDRPISEVDRLAAEVNRKDSLNKKPYSWRDLGNKIAPKLLRGLQQEDESQGFDPLRDKRRIGAGLQ